MPGFASSPATHAHHVGTPMFGATPSVNTARRVWVTWVQVEIPLGVTTTTDAGSASESASVVVAVPSTDANSTLTEATTEVTATTTTDVNAGITENVALNFVVADVNAGITEAVAPFVMVTPDVNSGITENVGLKSVSADTNSTLTESTLETYQAASTDADGTFTETGIITVPVSSTDANSTTTENVASSRATPDANSGITENVNLAAVSADANGTLTENTADKVVSPDTGSIAEVGTPVNKTTTTDVNSTTVESATIGGRRVRVTWVQVQIPAGVWILRDSGTGTDVGSPAFKTTDVNGSITENIVEIANLVPVTRTFRKSAAGLIYLYGDKRVTVSSPQLDSGTILPEVATLSNTISVDTGTATEAATIKVTAVTSSDSGTALLETVGLGTVSADTNNGIVEVSGRNAASADANAGITETATFASQFISSDSNTTSGEVTLVIVKSSIADNGTIAETVLTGIATSDAGVTTDAIVLVAVINATDLNGATAEVAGANAFTPVSASDNGSTIEAIALVATASTTDVDGTTTESGVSAFAQTSSDANTTTTESVNTSRAVVDFNNTSTENILLVATATDTATISESSLLRLSSLDTATGNDNVSNARITFTSTDHGSDTEFTIIKHPGFTGHVKMRMIPSASIIMKQEPSAYLQMRQIMSDVGSIDILQCEFRDRSGNLADPTTVDGWVEEPDGNVVELTFVKISTGVWEATYEITKYVAREDTWWRVQTSGNFQVVGQRKFAKIPEPHAVPA